MNFEESNSFVERMEKNNKNKKTVLTVLGVCAVLIIVLIAIISYISYKDSLQLKMYVDDTQVPISSTLLMQDNGQTYMNIRELANLLGYSYQKGEYKNYTEDSNSCYLRSDYEIASMTADSDTVTKYILNENVSTRNDEDENVTKEELITVDNTTGETTVNIAVESENETTETLTITEPIKYINNELYVPFSELPRIFNVQLNLSEENRIRIYSLKSLIQSAMQIAGRLGYSEVSNSYENLTAMVDNMLVVGNGTNYGVVSLADGQEIISLKYEKMVYMQNTKEFLVTAEDSVGIVASDGTTIIKPTEYDNISILDEFNKLYLVEKDGKYGVLNEDGETVVYAEYDSIGVENKEEFQEENIRNYNLLFDECIPVNLNGKVGIIDVEGNEKLKCVYDSLGYVANAATSSDAQNSNNRNTTVSNNEDDEDEEENTTNTNSVSTSQTSIVDEHDSVLTIPESVGIKGIVVNLNGQYGIYDVSAQRLLTPCVFAKIYSKTKSGVTTYYLEENGTEIELESYLEVNGLKNSDSNRTTQE